MPTDFAVFILTHGRADAVVTAETLAKQGYTGTVYLVVDNEDSQVAQYRARYGAQVLVFDKAAIAETFDEGDNFQDRRAVIYARNACFQLAQDLGIAWFLELDDDYTSFSYHFDSAFRYIGYAPVRDLDTLFAHVVAFYQTTPLHTLAFLQTGDMLGGARGGYSETVRTYRKAMNTFFCSPARPFQFVGRINEDVNTYTWLQSLGPVFLSINNVIIQQRTTQHTPGGMTELYLDSGTYIKSFYTVMYQPSSVTIRTMQSRHPRLHHLIDWASTVPCILAEKHRKSF